MAKRRYEKYKFSFNNESKLQNIWEIRLTLPRLIAMSVGVLTIVIIISVGIIMLTPLKTLLPGYMKQSQRMATIEAMLRLDSLQTAFNQNQAYLNNIINIYNTNRIPSDSIPLAELQQNSHSDSLIGASKAETRFIEIIEEREKYNISIFAPLAAEGMILTMPSSGGIISDDTKSSTTAKIIVPHGMDVNTITDGTIIDKYYNASSGDYTIIIQHDKGFISSYSGVGMPLIDKGDKVITGQLIATDSNINGKSGSHFFLQIWRNGIALIPADYIKENNFPKVPIIDEDVGRGK